MKEVPLSLFVCQPGVCFLVPPAITDAAGATVLTFSLGAVVLSQMTTDASRKRY
jgi:hypothetical protein